MDPGLGVLSWRPWAASSRCGSLSRNTRNLGNSRWTVSVPKLPKMFKISLRMQKNILVLKIKFNLHKLYCPKSCKHWVGQVGQDQEAIFIICFVVIGGGFFLIKTHELGRKEYLYKEKYLFLCMIKSCENASCV